MVFKKNIFRILSLGKKIKNPIPLLRFIQRYLSFFDRLMSLPPGFSITKSTLGGVKTEIIQPLDSNPKFTVFYIHGGAFILGLNNIYRRFSCVLAQAWGAKIILVDYSLAPSFPFPIAVNQLLNAYKDLLQSQSTTSLIIAGDSAGGNLALSILLAAKENGIDLPLCGILFSGWFDLKSTNRLDETAENRDTFISLEALSRAAKTYLQEFPNPELASPLYGNLKDLPPLFLQVGTREILRDDTLLLAQKAQTQMVKVQLELSCDMIHVQPILCPNNSKSSDLFIKMAAFIKEAQSNNLGTSLV